ncbi:hypothetical protein WDZ92_38215 [Nostoc sp. NIES-2111]
MATTKQSGTKQTSSKAEHKPAKAGNHEGKAMEAGSESRKHVAKAPTGKK